VATLGAGQVVRLRATPGSGSRFAGWSGAWRGRDGCTVSLGTDAAVRATFKKR
jgi:hypothetical protein